MFEDTLNVRPHLLVLNKMDLADLSNKQVKSLAATLAESISFAILQLWVCICSAENPEQAGKGKGETCSLHRLLKAER